MIETLLTEQRNPASERIDTFSTEQILTVINDEDSRVAPAVRLAIPQIAKAVEAIEGAIRASGRFFYVGAGTSGRLGVLDASECPPTFSVSYDLVQGIMAGGYTALYQATESSEDDPARGRKDLLDRQFTRNDVLCGVAASGRTPYVLGAIEAADALGAVTIGVSCTPDSQLSQAVAIPIEVLPGPEVVTGSTRLKAGTATKLVLNMLTTAAMIRLGYVYGNLMVNVQATNEKLRDRARRIIRDATGVDAERAAELLTLAGSVRVAIVMAIRNVDRVTAEEFLSHAGGVVRKALAEQA